MLRPFAEYRTWLFDCDGVLLDSNGIKSAAFHAAVRVYGEAAANRLLAYHHAHGGVSRFVKFDYFFSEILKRAAAPGERQAVLDDYARNCREGLMTCATAPGLLSRLAGLSPTVRKFVVTGGAETEVRDVFTARGLIAGFDDIFGSPTPKADIIERGLADGKMIPPIIFIGDSRYDYEVSRQFGCDFAFIYGWTEFAEWRTYFADRGVAAFSQLDDLFAEPQPRPVTNGLL